MTSLTMEFRGVQEEIIEKAIKKGYAKTKSEAVRMAIVEFGKSTGLISGKSATARKYAPEEGRKSFYDFAGAWKGMGEKDAKAIYKGIELARKSLNRSLAAKRVTA